MNYVKFYTGNEISYAVDTYLDYGTRREVGPGLINDQIPICVIESGDSVYDFLRKLPTIIKKIPESTEKAILSTFLKERSALTAFYNMANGNSWTDNRNWNRMDVPLHYWKGVSVRREMILVAKKTTTYFTLGHVVKLDLSHNNMYEARDSDNGKISPRIGDLSELRVLNLGYNFLSGKIPNEIFKLTKLRELYLHFNQLHGNISN